MRVGEDDRPKRTDKDDDYRKRLRPRSVTDCPICWCGRVFSSIKGIRIHQSRSKCYAVPMAAEEGSSSSSTESLLSKADRSGESYQSPGQTRDNPGQVSDHSTQVDPPLESSVEVVEKKRRVKWPAMADEKAWREFDEDISMMLENTLKGTSKRKLEKMGDLIYDVGKARFGLVELRERRPEQTPNRRQKEISRLRRELRSLKHQWKEAKPEDRPGLAALREQARAKLTSLRRAETQRKKRRKREQARRSFFANPNQFTKKLFEQSKNGELNVPQEELENHLRETYSDPDRQIPMADMEGLVKPTHPGEQFDLSPPKLSEVERFINKARSASAPGPSGVPYKVYKKCGELRKALWKLLKVIWRQDVVPLSWSAAEGVYIPKEESSSTLGQFRPISLLNVEGKIMFGILAERISSFVLENGYINTHCV